jgi:hypothetical protein
MANPDSLVPRLIEEMRKAAAMSREIPESGSSFPENGGESPGIGERGKHRPAFMSACMRKPLKKPPSQILGSSIRYVSTVLKDVLT